MASPKEESSTTSDWSGKVVIKARLEDDIRIIPIHNEDITYDELILMMQRVYRGTLNSSDEITIKYQDSDGDLITMFDDADLSYALHTSKVLKITIFSPSSKKQSIPDDVNIGEELSNIKLKLTKLIECLDVEKKLSDLNRPKTSSTPQESGRASVPVSKLHEGKEFDPLSNGTGSVSGRTSVESHSGGSFAPPLHKPSPQQFSPQKQQQFPPQPSQTFPSQSSQQQMHTPTQPPQSLPPQQTQSLPPQQQQPPSPYPPQAQQNTPYQPNQQYQQPQQQAPPQNIYQPPPSKQQAPASTQPPTNQNYQSYQPPPQANNYPQQPPNAQQPPQSYPTNPAFSTASNTPYNPSQPPQTSVAGQYNQYAQYKPPQGAYQPPQQFYPPPQQGGAVNPFARGTTGSYPRPQYPSSH